MKKSIIALLILFAASGATKMFPGEINLNLDDYPANDLCVRQMKFIQENPRDLLSLELLDSWGSFPPSGTFSGNLFDFGNFDQCIELRTDADAVGEIVGQHCTLLVPFDRNGHERSAKFMPPSRNPETNVGVGVCFPASCTPDQVKLIGNQILSQNFNITTSPHYDQSTFCTTKVRPLESTTALVLSSAAFFATILLIALASTAYDVTCSLRDIKPKPLLSSFSCFSNGKIILKLSPSSPKEILFLHGIRSLSMISIVLGHTYMITYWYVPATNAHSLIDWIGKASSMFVLTGFMGVDTFFLMSALLLTLSVFRELDKTKKLNLPMLYLKRYFRITVPVAAAILFTVSLLYHVANGPLWKPTINGAAVDLCERNWWSTLLYVGNYVSQGELCLGHSWYLMVDMQLYFLSPIILYPIWRIRKHTAAVISLIFLIASSSVIYVFVTFMINDLRVSFLSERTPLRENLVYTQTHARLDSWMMGIFVGYIMHRLEGKEVELSRASVAVGWSLSALGMLAVVFGQYPLNQENLEGIPILADAFYESFKRMSWCLSLGWIIIACHLSYGGFVKQFLSLPIWLPISKVSFCMYLIHVPVQLVYLSSIRSPQFFSNFRAIHKFFGDFGVSFIAALVWAVMFEFPTLNIINLLTPKRRP